MKMWSNDDLNKWLSTQKESPYHGEVPIIDPHHHLFQERTQKRVTEIATKNFGPRNAIQYNYLREEWEKDSRVPGLNIVATVHTEAGTSYDYSLPKHLMTTGETRFLLKVFQQNPTSQLCKGIIISIDLSLPENLIVEAVNSHLNILKGSECILSGIRIQIANHPQFLSQKPPGFVKSCVNGAKLIGKQFKLPIDVWLYHHQIPDLIDLCSACPDTLFVCDHIGMPIVTGENEKECFEEWKGYITQLSTYSNVVVKLGGLGMHCCGFSKDYPLGSDELVDKFSKYFIFVIQQFEVDRCFFESNFPMDKVSYSYLSFWNMAKKISFNSFPSSSSRRKLLFENANRIYKLNLLLPSLELYKDARL